MDGSPYYIGKGCDRRAYSKNHNVSLPPEDRIVLLKQNLTEEDALKHEIYMISVFGRKDLGTGVLHNRTDGGDNPPRNYGKCWNKGVPTSEETKQRISKSLKGRKHSEETKTKIGEANRKRIVSDETKQKISQSLKGKTKGKKHSEEHKRKVSDAKKKWWAEKKLK